MPRSVVPAAGMRLLRQWHRLQLQPARCRGSIPPAQLPAFVSAEDHEAEALGRRRSGGGVVRMRVRAVRVPRPIRATRAAVRSTGRAGRRAWAALLPWRGGPAYLHAGSVALILRLSLRALVPG